MDGRVRILSAIKDWTIYQHADGGHRIELHGDYEAVQDEDYPVIRIVNVSTGALVACDRLPCINKQWSYRATLEAGIYRLETGLALAAAAHNPLYLSRGEIIRHLFIGEIFIIAGQSNAAGYGRGPVADPPQYGVLMFNNGWQPAAHPIGHMDEDAANTDELNCGHSAWLNLGKLILNNHHLPVGLVPVSLNGSGIEMWGQEKPLYKNLIARARMTGARHLIWYQGCTDANSAAPRSYESRLDRLLSSLKRDLGDVTVYLVQISGTTSDLASDQGWRIVREAQRRMALKHGACLIPAYDLNNYSDDIHLGPADNIRLSRRVYERYAGRSKARPIGIERTDRSIKLVFHEIEEIESANLSCLDQFNRPVRVDSTAEKNAITIQGPLLQQVRYITLPFGRVYQGRTIRDTQGNCVSYFYIDLESADPSCRHC